MSNLATIADESRFIPIPDLREWYPKLGFSGRAELLTTGEAIFVTDPIYLERQTVRASTCRPGKYQFYLEQFTPKEQHKQWPHWYRNVVAQLTDA